MYIKITADSSCDLSQALVDRYDIGIFPLSVALGGKSLLDGLEITPTSGHKFIRVVEVDADDKPIAKGDAVLNIG